MIGRREVVAAIAGGVALPGMAMGAEPRVFTSRIAVENERLIMAVMIGANGPYTFMIDTGTYLSLIRPDLAKTLKLQARATERSQGVGGSDTYTLYLAQDVLMGGGLRQRDVMFSDAFKFGYNSGIYGALAAGMVTAIDTDVDFDAGEMRFYPDGRGDRPGFVAIDSSIPISGGPTAGSRRISATVLLDGRPIRCVLDTGSPSPLLLNNEAARRLGLWNATTPFAPTRPNGIGGAAPLARIVRTQSIEMGGAKQDRPLVTLLGNNVSGEFDGILGLSFLRRFNLSVDTHGRKLWVKPSAQTVPPQRYGLSGLWIDRERNRIEVKAVGTNSPAALAGVAVGDVLIDMPWEAALGMINGAPGKAVTLVLERDGARRTVSYTLAPYL
ncbi:aspartyl protease family protein [Sphingomonas sp. MMS24-J45]|uniref:aspartyl protease family protein n=1 Tax=Sphingomonas sp. MMS24-J45 TaxID=3238806 RepID=UPI00384CFF74